MAAKNNSAVTRSVSAKTERSIAALLEHAFCEMLSLLKNQGYSFDFLNREQIDEQEMNAIMFTVSSSNFKLISFLHFPARAQLPHAAYDLLPLDQKDAEQSYRDYVSELGNNLCGVLCRVLGAAGFSTGMSTPAILHNTNSTVHMRKIGVDCEKHVVASIETQPVFCASLLLFFNQGVNLDLDIPIPSKASGTEDLGELEFF